MKIKLNPEIVTAEEMARQCEEQRREIAEECARRIAPVATPQISDRQSRSMDDDDQWRVVCDEFFGPRQA